MDELFPKLAGGLGFALSPPAHLKRVSDEHGVVTLDDPEAGLRYMLFWFPGLHFDLSETHAAPLDRALGWHARALFDETYLSRARKPDDKPRTSESVLVRARRVRPLGDQWFARAPDPPPHGLRARPRGGDGPPVGAGA
ncbi:MAG: hypothetical protein QM765_33755 [Myxococcales bacterium]